MGLLASILVLQNKPPAVLDSRVSKCACARDRYEKDSDNSTLFMFLNRCIMAVGEKGTVGASV